MKIYIDRNPEQKIEGGSIYDNIKSLPSFEGKNCHFCLKKYIKENADFNQHPSISIWYEESNNNWAKFELDLYYVQDLTNENHGLTPVFAKNSDYALQDFMNQIDCYEFMNMPNDVFWVYSHDLSYGDRYFVDLKTEFKIVRRDLV